MTGSETRSELDTFENGVISWTEPDAEDYRGEVTLLSNGWVQTENGSLHPPHTIDKVLP